MKSGLIAGLTSNLMPTEDNRTFKITGHLCSRSVNPAVSGVGKSLSEKMSYCIHEESPAFLQGLYYARLMCIMKFALVLFC